MRKWLVLLLAAALLCCCACALAEEGFTFTAANTAEIGMPIPVSVTVPEPDGSVTVMFRPGAGYRFDGWGTTWNACDVRENMTFNYPYPIECGMEPGTYELECRWYRSDESSVSLYSAITLTGEKPTAPTGQISVRTANVGGTVTLSGAMGSADEIRIAQWRQEAGGSASGNTIAQGITPAADGAWTYSFQPDGIGAFYFYAQGYRADGAYCGKSEKLRLFVYEADAEQADGPSIEMTSYQSWTTYSDAQFQITAPDSSYSYVEAYITGEAGEEYHGNGYFNNGALTFSRQFQYAGDYTVSAVCFDAENRITKESSISIHADGKVRPVYGPVKIDLDVPDTWPAGQDMPVVWTPVDAGQTAGAELRVVTDDGDEHVDYWDFQPGENVLSGRYLQPGQYFLRATSRLDLWEDNEATFYFTVTENPAQPAGPTLVLPEKGPYCGIAFQVEAEDGWDELYAEVFSVDTDWRDATFPARNMELQIWNSGEYQITVVGKKNGIWSAPASSQTFTVTDVPAVSSPEIIMPDKAAYGAEFEVAALLPENGQHVTLWLFSNGKKYGGWGAGLSPDTRYYHWRIEDYQCLEMGIVPGALEAKVVFTDTAGKEYTAVYPFELTGNMPAAPTITVSEWVIEVGQSFTLSGMAGDAEKLEIYWDVSQVDGNSIYDRQYISAQADGAWSYTFTAPAAGRYYAYVKGYSAQGLCTGFKNVHRFAAYDENSLAAPTVTLSQEELRTDETFTLSYAAEADVDYWEVYVQADGATETSFYGYEIIDARHGQTTISQRYAGDYTITVSYRKLGNGEWSTPTVLHLNITGTPRPTHGEVPIQVEIPQVILAGKDLTVVTTAAAAGQQYSMRLELYENGEYHEMGYISADESGKAVFDGRLVNPGSYMLRVWSNADDWYDNYEEYTFQVAENPDRPSAPNIQLSESNIYLGMNVYVQAEGEWDEITVRVTGEYRNSVDTALGNKYLLSFWDVGDYQVTAACRKNDVWTKMTAPLAVTAIDVPAVNVPQVIIPDSIVLGEDLPVFLLLPETAPSEVDLYLVKDGKRYGGWGAWRGDRRYAQRTIEGFSILDAGCGAGQYEVTVTYENQYGKTEEESHALTITGSMPEFPTVSVPAELPRAGETLTLSGAAGSADWIRVHWWVQKADGAVDNIYLYDLENDGTWSCSFTLPDSGSYAFIVYGYTNQGLSTGMVSDSLYIYGENSPQAPEVSLSSGAAQAGEEFVLTCTAPEDADDWEIVIMPDGHDEPYYPGYDRLDSRSMKSRCYLQYGGGYTASVKYRRSAVDEWSFVKDYSFNVSGTPWPTHGKVPLNVTIPDKLSAGEDLSVVTHQEVEGQIYWATLYQSVGTGKGTKWLMGMRVPASGTVVFSGAFLQEGTYQVYISAEADDWLSNGQWYTIHVAQNPDQADAPVFTLPTGEIYQNVLFKIAFQDAWDEVYGWVEQDDSRWSDFSEEQLSLSRTGDFTMYVAGRKNGVWSKLAQTSLTVSETPAVEKLTLQGPAGIQIGENAVFTVYLPEAEGNIQLDIQKNGVRCVSYFNSMVQKTLWFDINTDIFIYDGPGEYEAIATWNKPDGTQEIQKMTFTAEGTVPVPPTVSLYNYCVNVGQAFHLSGTAGTADRLEIEWNVSNNQGEWIGGKVQPQIQADGTWQYSLTASEAGVYYVNVRGYTSQGLSTGSAYLDGFIAKDGTGMAAPTISNAPESVQAGERFTFNAAAPIAARGWLVIVQDDETKESKGDKYYLSSAAADDEIYSYIEYAGTYTIYVSYQNEENGTWSKPAEVHVTATGTKRPTHGEVPIAAVVPENALAGVDLTITTTAQVEGQRYSASLYLKNEGFENRTWLDYTAAEENGNIGFPGFHFQPGTYQIYLSSNAEDWMNASQWYTFTVQENPSQPAAPALTRVTADPNTAAPVEFRLDKNYDDICVTRTYEGNRWGTLLPQTKDGMFEVWFSDAGAWTASVQYCQNGVWSKPSAALAFTVAQAPLLDAPELVSWPNEVHIGETYSVTFMGVEHAARYDLCIYQRGNVILEGSINSTETGPITISASAWTENAVPGNAEVNIYAYADGYDSGKAYCSFYITVLNPGEEERILDLPDMLTEIGAEAFAGVNATRVIIHDGCIRIGSRAFADCPNLTYVEIPDTVKNIEGDAFAGCGNVTIITVKDSYAFDYAQYYKMNVEVR